ncbi:MAG: hypothetical protein PHX61_02250 [Alphaproteobacteria bacterium]|nr:hypothetical protein [Alphaproteobacteria bacterium]
MSESEKDAIEAAGIPLDTYLKGYTDLGSANGSAVGRFAVIATNILKHNLPIPPSPFTEMIVDRTTGFDKQDFRETLDGPPGIGKSYSAAYKAGRYAIEAAERFGQDPKDYFCKDNCALLEDTEKIMQILDEADKQQAIIIDDAGVSAGNRDFATQSNKNISKVIQTCRTKRWYVQFNMPVVTHIDLQIRELVTAKSRVFKAFHAGGFNLLKTNSSHIRAMFPKNKEYNPRFEFFGRKFDFWIAYCIDIMDAYKGFSESYDKARDAAADRLIHMISNEERDANDPRSKTMKRWDDEVKKLKPIIQKMLQEDPKTPIKHMMRETGLTEYKINKMISIIRGDKQ